MDKKCSSRLDWLGQLLETVIGIDFAKDWEYLRPQSVDLCPCRILRFGVVPMMDTFVVGRMIDWRNMQLAFGQDNVMSDCWDGRDRRRKYILYHNYTVDVSDQV